MGVDADAFGRTMIHRDEHRGLTFAGEGGRQIGAPHRVHRLGDDRAIVRVRSAGGAHTGGCQQIMFAHQAEHAP
jgi:hypothetical protein